MRNGKWIKPVIILTVIAILVIIVGVKAKGTYDDFMKEYKGTEHVSGKDVTVEIPQGASTKKIASILKEAGLIKYEYAFELRVKDSEYRGKLQPGTYTLNTGMNTGEMIAAIAYVKPERVVTGTLTIPEGYSIEQIANKCEEQGFCTAAEFLQEITSGTHEIPFEGQISAGVNYELQGFMFPATYDLYEDMTVSELVDNMIAAFNNVYTDEYKSRAAELGYTDYQVLTMASIVEREAALDEERPIIAGVIYNRLNIDMPLQMCPTVLYPITNGIYDKNQVTYADLEVDSPYNTYKNNGLPVGPICNPGKSSIEAVLYPTESNYLYYHTSDAGDGSHIFTETYEEHINTQ